MSILVTDHILLEAFHISLWLINGFVIFIPFFFLKRLPYSTLLILVMFLFFKERKNKLQQIMEGEGLVPAKRRNYMLEEGGKWKLESQEIKSLALLIP